MKELTLDLNNKNEQIKTSMVHEKVGENTIAHCCLGVVVFIAILVKVL